jgi:hypothetical protein
MYLKENCGMVMKHRYKPGKIKRKRAGDPLERLHPKER